MSSATPVCRSPNSLTLAVAARRPFPLPEGEERELGTANPAAYARTVQIVIETDQADFIEAPSQAPWGRAAAYSLLAPTPDAAPIAPRQRLVVRSGFLPDEDGPDRPD